MASQILSRLGIVLAVDSGELVHGITEAQKNFDNLSRQGKRATEALAKDMLQLKYATEDYGKTLTKVEQVEREIRSGRYQGADQNAIDTARRLAKAYDERVNSMKKVNGLMNEQQKLQVGYQVTDFVTQIASGQNAMIAFIQQGGQLKDTMGGVGNAFRALASFITPVNVAFAVTAASIAAISFAVYKAQEELNGFNKALGLSGGYAGIAYGEFLQLGNILQSKTNTSIGDARDAMMALVDSAKFTKTSIAAVGEAVLRFAKATGVDGKEAAAKLIPLLDGTASSAKALNDKYHMLTIEQYRQIEALERQGKLQESIKLQAELLTQQFSGIEKKLGTLQNLWKDVGEWASWAWDKMLNIGREDDTVIQLEKINSEIVKTMKTIAEKRALGMNTQLMDAELEKLKAKFQTTLDKLVSESEAAAAKAKLAEENERRIRRRASAGGLKGEISAKREAEQAELDAYYKSREAMATEEEKITLEFAKKVAEAYREEYQRNEDTFGEFAASYARKRVAKVAEAEAEAEGKRFEYRKKQAWEAASKEFEQETEVVFRLMSQRDKIMKDAQDKRQEQSYAKEELDLRFSLIGATQKEIEVMHAKIEAQKELDRLTRTKEFMSMTEEEQNKAKKIYEDTLQAKIANIELAESLQRMQGMYDAVWSNMSAAIENFVRTGKFSIKDFTRSVIQDMLVMQMKLQAMTLIRGLLGSLFAKDVGILPGNSPLSATSADIMARRASGGPVSAGSPYLVGERGPEVFMPSGSGTIIPNGQLAGMGSTTNVTNNYINAIDVKSFEDRLLQSSNTIWAANQYANKSLATNGRRA